MPSNKSLQRTHTPVRSCAGRQPSARAGLASPALRAGRVTNVRVQFLCRESSQTYRNTEGPVS